MTAYHDRDSLKVAKGASVSFVGSVTGRALWFLSQVIIARFFGAEVFGLYILGLVVLKITELLARFGLHEGAMRFVSIYRKNSPERVRGIIISALLITFANGLVIGGLVYLSAAFISGSLFHKPELAEVIEIFAFCVPLMATMTVVATASLGFHTTKYYVYVKDIIQPLANIILILITILLGLGFLGVVFAYVISQLTALLAGLCFVIRLCLQTNQKKAALSFNTVDLLTYSYPLLFSGFFVFLISWIDTLMLGFLKSSSEVGIYRAASQIPLFLSLILMATNSIYAPAIAEMYHKNQIRRLEKLFKTTTRWVFYITLPIALVIISSSKEIMLIFGHDFVEIGSSVLIMLTCAKLINCVTGGVALTLNMTGKQHTELLNSIGLFIINIFLNYILIPIYGGFGAAIATSISIIAINCLRLIEVYYFYKIHPYNYDYIKVIVAGMTAIIVLFIITSFSLNIHSFVIFLVNCFAVFIIFCTFYGIIGLGEDDKFVFESLVKKSLVIVERELARMIHRLFSHPLK
jgi:O-antigen/teichoic acid export membrane protein